MNNFKQKINRFLEDKLNLKTKETKIVFSTAFLVFILFISPLFFKGLINFTKSFASDSIQMVMPFENGQTYFGDISGYFYVEIQKPLGGGFSEFEKVDFYANDTVFCSENPMYTEGQDYSYYSYCYDNLTPIGFGTFSVKSRLYYKTGEYIESDPVTITIKPQDKIVPIISSFDVEPKNSTTGEVNLSWTVTDSGGANVDKVEVWRSPYDPNGCTATDRTKCKWFESPWNNQKEVKAPKDLDSWSGTFKDDLSTYTVGSTFVYAIRAFDGASNTSSGSFMSKTDALAFEVSLGSKPLSPPNISNVQVKNITNTTATISWSTDESGDTQVDFTGGPCPSNTINCSIYLSTDLSNDHVINLTGLSSGTTYTYVVKSQNAAGQTKSIPATFTTQEMSISSAFLNELLYEPDTAVMLQKARNAGLTVESYLYDDGEVNVIKDKGTNEILLTQRKEQLSETGGLSPKIWAKGAMLLGRPVTCDSTPDSRIHVRTNGKVNGINKSVKVSIKRPTGMTDSDFTKLKDAVRDTINRINDSLDSVDKSKVVPRLLDALDGPSLSEGININTKNIPTPAGKGKDYGETDYRQIRSGADNTTINLNLSNVTNANMANVLGHEIGHAYGLDHSNTAGNIMREGSEWKASDFDGTSVLKFNENQIRALMAGNDSSANLNLNNCQIDVGDGNLTDNSQANWDSYSKNKHYLLPMYQKTAYYFAGDVLDLGVAGTCDPSPYPAATAQSQITHGLTNGWVISVFRGWFFSWSSNYGMSCAIPLRPDINFPNFSSVQHPIIYPNNVSNLNIPSTITPASPNTVTNQDLFNEVISNNFYSPPSVYSVSLKNNNGNNLTISPDGLTSQTITLTASDVSGVENIKSAKVVINHQGAKSGLYGGYIAWNKNTSPFVSGKDEKSCSGEGYASINPNQIYNPSFITLDSCSVSISGYSKTINFVIKFTENANLPSTGNTVSGFTSNDMGSTGWKTGFSGTIFNANPPKQNDTTPPTVSITSPKGGDVLTGIINVLVTGSDNIGVSSIQAQVDGVNFGSPVTTGVVTQKKSILASVINFILAQVTNQTKTYTISVDTNKLSNGNHTLTAAATDASGNTATSSPITVTVSNDTTAPTAKIFNIAGQSSSGSIEYKPTVLYSATSTTGVYSLGLNISFDTSDNVGVTNAKVKVEKVGGTSVVEMTEPRTTKGMIDNYSAFVYYFEPMNMGGLGQYKITATVFDKAGNSSATSTIVNITPDKTPPTVSITAPVANSTVSGNSVTISADALDSVAVVGVQFKLDGVNIGAEDTVFPRSILWDSKTATNGTHTLTAVARDAAGNTKTSSGVSVTVNNVTQDTTSPTVSITSPANNSIIITGLPNIISVTATDNVGVVGVQFKVDGKNIYSEDLISPYSIKWTPTSFVSDGLHTLVAVARDSAGNKASSTPITVNMNANADLFPITTPSPNSTVSGTINIGGSVLDSIQSTMQGVAGVQFKIDGPNGLNLGLEDITSPYSISWDTKGTTNGNHTLMAIVRGVDGLSYRGNQVTITVNNVVAPTNLAPSGTAYRWSKNTTSTSNSNRVAVTGLNDNNLTTDVHLNGGSAETAARYEAGGVVWSTAKTISSVKFINGTWASSGDGGFGANLKLQTTTDGVTWVDSSWTVSPSYSYNSSSVSGKTYTFSGTAVSVKGVRISGQVRNITNGSSYWVNMREVQAF